MSRRRKLEDILESEYVTIGELVRLSEVRYSTLKHYTETGLLPFEQEDDNLTRRYKRVETLSRIEEIATLRKNKMSIAEIISHFDKK